MSGRPALSFLLLALCLLRTAVPATAISGRTVINLKYNPAGAGAIFKKN
jgi:hypothetical protein